MFPSLSWSDLFPPPNKFEFSTNIESIPKCEQTFAVTSPDNPPPKIITDFFLAFIVLNSFESAKYRL